MKILLISSGGLRRKRLTALLESMHCQLQRKKWNWEIVKMTFLASAACRSLKNSMWEIVPSSWRYCGLWRSFEWSARWVSLRTAGNMSMLFWYTEFVRSRQHVFHFASTKISPTFMKVKLRNAFESLQSASKKIWGSEFSFETFKTDNIVVSCWR